MKQFLILLLLLVKNHQLLEVTHSLRQPPYQQLIDHLPQELVVLEERREDQEQIKHLEIDPLPILRQATFIEVQQPLEIINQIILENSQLLDTRTHATDARYLPAHQVTGTHKFMGVEV